MEKREEALREALFNNAAESARWEAYFKENQQAIENLEQFSKHLTVEVMVPVGRKAFTAGQLIHTNEVMVGHYQGYFSKCSSHTAKQICEHRIRMATVTLEKLNTEADMWQNKLEKPYLDGVIPCADQREIIEDYDEERERIWREEHKVRVRLGKLREKQEIDEATSANARRMSKKQEEEGTVEDVTQMLEDAELEENFREELENLELDDTGDTDEILKKLMSGEMQLPPSKPRVARTPKDSEVKFPNMLPGIVKKTLLQNIHSPPTNNNFRVNPEMLLTDDGGNESDASDFSDQPEEVQLIEEQAKFLPTCDRIGFYQYQLQIIEQKLLSSTVATPSDIEQKLCLFKVREHLEDLLEQAEEAEGAAELAASEKNAEDDDEAVEKSSKKPQKKRISFSQQNHTIEFRQNESVAEMLLKSATPPPQAARDIIRLDDELIKTDSLPNLTPSSPAVDKKQNILNKVEENYKCFTEQQSTQDFDLVNKILGNVENMIHTLHINFKHSTKSAKQVATHEGTTTTTSNNDPQIPGSPADLYAFFGCTANKEEQEKPTSLFIDAYEGEDKVKVPAMKEQDRKFAYKDLRVEFSNPIAQSKAIDNTSDEPQGLAMQMEIHKSILRNRNAEVNTDLNPTNANTKKKNKISPNQALNENAYMSAYDKVMHDVVEKPLTEPEPLPNGKYIDALAPKKRVSRFKQMRSGVEQT